MVDKPNSLLMHVTENGADFEAAPYRYRSLGLVGFLTTEEE